MAARFGAEGSCARVMYFGLTSWHYIWIASRVPLMQSSLPLIGLTGLCCVSVFTNLWGLNLCSFVGKELLLISATACCPPKVPPFSLKFSAGPSSSPQASASGCSLWHIACLRGIAGLRHVYTNLLAGTLLIWILRKATKKSWLSTFLGCLSPPRPF